MGRGISGSSPSWPTTPTRIACSATCAASGFACSAARICAEPTDGRSRSTAKRFTCPPMWPPAHAISACGTAPTRRARSDEAAGSARGWGCRSRCVRPSGCHAGARWPRAPISPRSCTPRAIPPSTFLRSRRSRAASCGGAVSSAGTSGRRQSEPAPLALAVLNALVNGCVGPGPSLASDHFKLFTPACLPSGTRSATAALTRRGSARARS